MAGDVAGSEDARRAYEDVVARWSGEPGVSVGRVMGNSDVLKVEGRIFAFRKGDRLVIKVPADRAAALVAAGLAIPFQTGRSPMREWVALALPAGQDSEPWQAWAAEAHAFVAALPATPSRGRPKR